MLDVESVERSDAALSGELYSAESRLLRGLLSHVRPGEGEEDGVGERGGESGERVEVEVGRVGGGEGDGDVKAVFRRCSVRAVGGVSGWKRLCRMVRIASVVRWCCRLSSGLGAPWNLWSRDGQLVSYGDYFRAVVREECSGRTSSIKSARVACLVVCVAQDPHRALLCRIERSLTG